MSIIARGVMLNDEMQNNRSLIFTKDEREFYNLEKMLAEIPEIDIEHLK